MGHRDENPTIVAPSPQDAAAHHHRHSPLPMNDQKHPPPQHGGGVGAQARVPKMVQIHQ